MKDGGTVTAERRNGGFVEAPRALASADDEDAWAVGRKAELPPRLAALAGT
jgi:hypothetical protein